MIKLIAIDLDGTLLTNQKTISQKNRQVIAKAKAQGLTIVLCTGRPLKSMVAHIETLGLTDSGDYAITFNGGLIQKNDTGEIVLKEVMSLADVASIYDLAVELEIPVDVISNETVFQLKPQPAAYPSLYHQLNSILDFTDSGIADLPVERDYNKMVCATDPAYLEQQTAKIPASYHQRYNIVRSGPSLLEILNKNVSKAFALAELGHLLGIEANEMMALGDEENDLSMIKYAGLGVAMGNASDEIKAASHYVTDTNERDGVAKAIEKYVLNQAQSST